MLAIYIILILDLIFTSESRPTLTFIEDESGFIFSLNCHFKGVEISRRRSRGKDCGSLCLENEDCSHFTWTNLEGGTCLLMKNREMGADQAELVAGHVCGFVKERVNSNMRP